jgi:F-type H+-transporting ATPase subunit delta
MPQAVSYRYARALVDAVLDSKADSALVPRQIEQFENLLHQSGDLKNVLLSPAVSGTRKRAVVERFAGMMSLERIVRNFLFVLINHRRIDLLGEIRQAYEVVLDERLGILRSEVKSAQPLTDEQRNKVQGELSRIAGQQVRCDYKVEEKLLGGVTAKVGSTVYDGSVRAQLETMRQRLSA